MKRYVLARAARISAALAASGAGIGTVAALSAIGSAHADPTYAVAKVGVGSDTIQDVFDAYAGSEPFSGPNQKILTPLFDSAHNVTLASWDAIPFGGSASAPGCIYTHLGGPQFDRPNGSGAGVKALRASSGSGSDPAGVNFWQASTASCTGAPISITGAVDFARSSRPPDASGTNLTFIPFARDGVTYALLQKSGDPNNLGALTGTENAGGVTTSQLYNIYNSTAPGGGAVIGTDTVRGCLPNASSGTAKFWITLLSTPPNIQSEATAAGCNGSPTEENSANAFNSVIGGNTRVPSGSCVNPGDAGCGIAYIIPFSVGSWVAQFNGAATDNSATGRSAGVVLGDPDGVASGSGGPVTGTTTLTPNTNYYMDNNYGRDVFVVVPTNKISGLSADHGLQGLFAGSGSIICGTTAQTTAHTFGFDSLVAGENTKDGNGATQSPLCGDTTLIKGND